MTDDCPCLSPDSQSPKVGELGDDDCKDEACMSSFLLNIETAYSVVRKRGHLAPYDVTDHAPGE